MAPTTINKNGSQQAKPGPKTSPSTDTAPPIGKYGRRQLNTIRKSISKKDTLTLAEKLHILDVMRKKGWNQPQTAEYFNTIEGYEGWVTQYSISRWKRQEKDWKTQVMSGDINGTARRI